MGTHPIFESDFDCLTENDSLCLTDVESTPTVSHRVMGSSSAWDPKDLCRLDDLATGLILDPKLHFVTHKMNLKYRPDRTSWSKIRTILSDFQLLATDLGQTQYTNTFNRLKSEYPK